VEVQDQLQLVVEEAVILVVLVVAQEDREQLLMEILTRLMDLQIQVVEVQLMHQEDLQVQVTNKGLEDQE
jgi:hypothetical protein|tara:strand:- start:36 stop:245 length:210 start_codon:yes stop_codon:yes gene_type:complete